MGRIASLPRRDWRDTAAEHARALTSVLRQPHGVEELRPAQGQALFEIAQQGGGFFGLDVGAGKTHIAALAPTLLNSQRPLLVVPGKLANPKYVKRVQDGLRQNWILPPWYPTKSYNWLALDAQEDYIANYKPDCLVFDESQKLKRLEHASVARRTARYRNSGAPCAFIFLSGSPTLDGISDFWHLLDWALGDGNPLPRDASVMYSWGNIVDAKRAEGEPDFGVLRADLGECVSIGDARAKIQRRICETPGVIISTEPFGGPLSIGVLPYEVPEVVNQYYPKLRDAWLTPEDFPLTMPVEVWAHALRLSVGLQHEWDPWPPDEWREARRDYGRFVRTVLDSQFCDTEKQVRTAVETGRLASPEYFAWQKIKHTWIPDPVKTIMSPHVLGVIAQWGRTEGVIWVYHRELGKFISKEMGIPYYTDSGLDANGRSIDEAKGGLAVASVEACSEGFNLQYTWHSALYLEYPRSAQQAHQGIGRCHRGGQEHPVDITFAVGCAEHSGWLWNALNKARYAQEILHLPQKMLQVPVLGIEYRGNGPAWEKEIKNDECDTSETE